MKTTWWLNQATWTMCSSNWIISPEIGVKIKWLKPLRKICSSNLQVERRIRFAQINSNKNIWSEGWMATVPVCSCPSQQEKKYSKHYCSGTWRYAGRWKSDLLLHDGLKWHLDIYQHVDIYNMWVQHLHPFLPWNGWNPNENDKMAPNELPEKFGDFTKGLLYGGQCPCKVCKWLRRDLSSCHH